MTTDPSLPHANVYALIDLHLHLDGSLSPKSVKELAAMQNIPLPENEDELLSMLRIEDDCRNLNEYLEKFAFPISLLQTKKAISRAVYNLCKELKAQGLRYAEIRFAPQFHQKNGLTQEQVVKAAIRGKKHSRFRSNLILCCMRGDDNHKANLETVRVAKKFLGKGICAIDIAGAEALFPTRNFEDIFALARKLHVPYTIHAGEADGPESIYSALSFGAKRIGHGVRCIEDSRLMKKLAEEGTVLELCPTSNLHTNTFETIRDFPLRKLIEAGIKVTINTDNMTISGTTMESEMQKLIDTFSLTEEELNVIVQNAVNASFADEMTKYEINVILTAYNSFDFLK